MKHLRDCTEALMQYVDKSKVLVESTSLEGKLDGIHVLSETKLVSLLAMLMSGEAYLVKSLMAISLKDMIQQPKVRYIQVHCTCLKPFENFSCLFICQQFIMDMHKNYLISNITSMNTIQGEPNFLSVRDRSNDVVNCRWLQTTATRVSGEIRKYLHVHVHWIL